MRCQLRTAAAHALSCYVLCGLHYHAHCRWGTEGTPFPQQTLFTLAAQVNCLLRMGAACAQLIRPLNVRAWAWEAARTAIADEDVHESRFALPLIDVEPLHPRACSCHARNLQMIDQCQHTALTSSMVDWSCGSRNCCSATKRGVGINWQLHESRRGESDPS
jgi:hypothetical protein